MKFFREKFPFSWPKFLMTFFIFLVTLARLFGFSLFLSQIFSIFYYVQCRIGPFPHKNNHYFRKEFPYDTFFTLFVLSRTSDNTTSLNIGETDAWVVPHLKYLGGPSPSPPRPPPLGPGFVGPLPENFKILQCWFTNLCL